MHQRELSQQISASYLRFDDTESTFKTHNYEYTVHLIMLPRFIQHSNILNLFLIVQSLINISQPLS